MNDATETPVPVAHAVCANCHAPMLGPYCYACGQPEKGMIRHLATVVSDIGDTIFNIDSRILHTLWPLFVRPGFLTLEYFAGRRVRYVTPFRLFFFLSIITFFAIQTALSISGFDNTIHVGNGASDGIGAAKTSAEVTAARDSALSGLEASRNVPGLPASALQGIQRAEEEVRARADARLRELQAAPAVAAPAPGEPAAPAPTPPSPPAGANDADAVNLDFLGWNPAKEPLHITWAPAFVNGWLANASTRIRDNLIAARRDPRHMIGGVFSVLPQTLFVLMPLFAVLLKIVYIFKRRYYMEHFMVALHSHAFILLSLLLITIVALLAPWATAHLAWLSAPFGLATAALWIWIPVYLYIMQKRVYRQGWIMTTLKYWLVGISYLVILAFGLTGALLVSLAST
ncbi:MAG: DUF3667 domain-containing protein [Lysobacterales bacterium]